MVMKSHPKLAAGALGISAALLLVDMVSDEGKVDITQLIQLLATAGIAGAMIGGPWGAAIAIGIVLVVLGIKWATNAAEQRKKMEDIAGNNEMAFEGKAFNELKPYEQSGSVVNFQGPTMDPELEQQLSNFTIDWTTLGTEVDTANSKFTEFNKNVTNSVPEMQDQIGGNSGLGFYIGGDQKGSYPIVYSLGLAEQAWFDMGAVAVGEINKIIASINAIPREVVTIHRIRTVKEDGGSSSGGIISNFARSVGL